mmetsp:Transcript_11445/g.17266  ORF Transcript_11445/g.17266 Transcript_11445/m.17266 type:complete len:159 (-) Transcript_11445:153-629(-)
MGCGCAKATEVSDPRAAQERQDAKLARQMQRQEDASRQSGGRSQPQQKGNSWGGAGPGRQLGGSAPEGDGLTPEERRQKALEAAEKRQQNVPGVSQQKAAELREKQAKDELLGKLTEYYHKKKMDLPMGMNMATSDQLRKHWDFVRGGGDPTAQVLAA